MRIFPLKGDQFLINCDSDESWKKWSSAAISESFSERNMNFQDHLNRMFFFSLFYARERTQLVGKSCARAKHRLDMTDLIILIKVWVEDGNKGMC